MIRTSGYYREPCSWGTRSWTGSCALQARPSASSRTVCGCRVYDLCILHTVAACYKVLFPSYAESEMGTAVPCPGGAGDDRQQLGRPPAASHQHQRSLAGYSCCRACQNTAISLSELSPHVAWHVCRAVLNLSELTFPPLTSHSGPERSSGMP